MGGDTWAGGNGGRPGDDAPSGGYPGCVCDAVACAPGEVEVPDGECCWQCASQACVDQRQAYAAQREQTLLKYYPESAGCSTAQDCGGIANPAACGASVCDQQGYPLDIKEDVESDLAAFAQPRFRPIRCAAGAFGKRRDRVAGRNFGPGSLVDPFAYDKTTKRAGHLEGATSDAGMQEGSGLGVAEFRPSSPPC